ncbi:hypothetical protein [Idiomarina fontislapidosi]|uniref:hypothetical protein n=1 Tax=Idiomarina fontislapidosi TaxID=263723 RepID=UPI000F85F1F1|nr:hypothetical protein [Idiomarina fontislapidosi]
MRHIKHRPAVGRAFCATPDIGYPTTVRRASCATSTIALAPKAQATSHPTSPPAYVAHFARHRPSHLAPKAQATSHPTSPPPYVAHLARHPTSDTPPTVRRALCATLGIAPCAQGASYD